MSVVEEIKSRIDITGYIQQQVPLKKAGRYYKANCPFHSEKTPSFIVNPETQSWRCFGSCAEGGDLFSFAMKHHGWSFHEALEELGRQAGVELRPRSDEQRQQSARRDVLLGLVQAAVDWYQARLWDTPRVLAYARERRGFTDETLRAAALGHAPEGWQHLREHLTQLGYSDEDLLEAGLVRRNDYGRVYDYFRDRLLIPIRDGRGRVVGFGARALKDEDEPKYLNSRQSSLFDKSRLLYGLDRGRRAIRDKGVAVIVEGYMDVLQAQQAGHMNVVAQMGTSLTEAQLRLLTPRLAQRVVLALDADSAGQNATMRSLEVARQTMQADYSGRLALDMRVLELPAAMDPDDLIRADADAWAQRVADATPVADYVIGSELASLPAGATVQEREVVARRLLPLLLASENRLYTRDNLQKLAMGLRIGEAELLQWAQRQPPAPGPRTRGGDAAQREGAAGARQPVRDEQRRERDFMSNLLRQPELLFRIDRKFRELAAGDTQLLRGPLAAFGMEDFLSRDCGGLLRGLLEALGQDELAPVAWIQQHGDELQRESLRQLEREIQASELEQARSHLREGFAADLTIVVKRSDGIDWQRELVRMALRLRRLRLERERQELFYLMSDGDEGKDGLHERVKASVMARSLIDTELQRQAPAQ